MAEDDRVGIAVRRQQPLQVERGLGQSRNRKRDVLDDDGRADLAHRAHRRKHALAHVPVARAFGRVGREAHRLERRHPGKRRLDRADLRGERRRIRRRASRPAAPRRSGPSARMPSGRPGLPSTERSAARSASSTAATGALFSTVTARHAVSRSSNRISALALSAYSGTVRYVISLRNPSVPSEPIIRCARTSIGSVEVDQRIQAVAGRVLHAELVADARGERVRCRARPARAHPARAPGRVRRSTNAARLAGSRVSSTVPSARTTRSPASVW